jgi:hypothetical protein
MLICLLHIVFLRHNIHFFFLINSDCMHSTNSNSNDMSTGHSLKNRAEQERISSFLHDITRR